MTKASKRRITQKTDITDSHVDNSSIETLNMDYCDELLALYGEKTLMDRSIPCLQDGCKPVHRRILYAMFKLGLKPGSKPAKASKISGETMGNYHPHGNKSIDDAMVTLVKHPDALIDGVGTGWGGLMDGPAAPRYIEGRLTQYAFDNFFSKGYVDLTRLKLNYDDARTEPVFLPSLTCNILVNGDFGISVAKMCHLPRFTLESVNKLIIKAIKVGANGKDLTTNDYIRTLKFSSTYGGHFEDTETNWDNFKKLIETGKGSIRFMPDYEVSEDLRTITITGFPKLLQPKSGEDVAKPLEQVDNMEAVKEMRNLSNMENGNMWVVELKPAEPEELEKAIEGVVTKFAQRNSYNVGYIDHHDTGKLDDHGLPVIESSFRENSIKGMFYEWLEWRLVFEEEYIEMRIQEVENRIEKLKLDLLAHTHRHILDECRDKEDYRSYVRDEFLKEGYELSEESVSHLLKMTVEKLTRLAARDQKAEIAREKTVKKEIEASLDRIDDEVIERLQSMTASQ